jgi:hypothetical protein
MVWYRRSAKIPQPALVVEGDVDSLNGAASLFESVPAPPRGCAFDRGGRLSEIQGERSRKKNMKAQ